MLSISRWAKSHRWAARTIIVSCYVLLNILGWKTGVLLHEAGVAVSGAVLTAIVAVYFAGVFLYPVKAKRGAWSRSRYYVQQKTCDFLLIASTFGLIVCWSNQDRKLPLLPEAKASVSSPLRPLDDSLKKYKSVVAFVAAMKDQSGQTLKWKDRKQVLKQQVKEIKKAPGLSATERTLLIILFVLLAVALEMAVLALSCSLSCSGAEGAAILVGVGGTALTIFLLVLGIRSLNKKRQTIKQSGPAPTDRSA